MPYIKHYKRDVIDPIVVPEDVGGLTFVLYKQCLIYLGTSPRYQNYAEVMGALEATKLELYRRHIAPYEDTKIEENGDIGPDTHE